MTRSSFNPVVVALVMGAFGALIGTGVVVYLGQRDRVGPATIASAPAPMTAAAPALPAADPGSLCDRSAAHPDDPAKPATVAGVADEDLDAEAAIEACASALESQPDQPRYRFQLGRALFLGGLGADAEPFLAQAAETGHAGAAFYLAQLYLGGADDVQPQPDQVEPLLNNAAARGFAPARALLEELAQVEAEAAEAERQAALAAEAAAAAARPRFTSSGFEQPRLIEAVYNNSTADLPERATKIYLVNMVDTIRNVCRGTFTIAEHEQLKYSVVDASDMTVQAGGAAMLGALMNLAELVQNPGKMMKMAQNESMAEKIPEMANNDAMLLIERHGCESAELGRFNTNLRGYFSGAGGPANMTAEVYYNACLQQARGTHYPPDQFCPCFLDKLNGAGLSRADKTALQQDFWPYAQQLMAADPGYYAVCNGSLAGGR